MVDIISSSILANSYIIKNDKNEALIVDPGDNTNNRLINHINKIGVKIVGILLTHCHFDHIMALKDVLDSFPDAVTYISEDEIELIDNPRFNLSYSMEKKLIFMPKNAKVLSDYEMFKEIGKTIEMIKTPFHTKGSAVFYIKDDGIMFSGDTLFYSSIGRSDLPSGSEKSIANSLRKIINLPKETIIYPGHGIKTTLEREIKYNTYLKYL